MSNQYLIGIDAGTSKIKVVLFDIEGNELYIAARKNRIISDNHWMEQDMNKIWDHTVDAIHESINNLNLNPKNIKAIGISGQGEGCWLIDEYGNPVRNAIIWSDSRAVKLVDDIKKDMNISKKIREITGSNIFPGATSAILKWLKENEKESLDKAKYCLFCKDWIRYKLTNKVGIELTDASTSILDLDKSLVSQELFKLLDIEEYMELFPNINSPLSGERINDNIAKILGLSPVTKVSVGMLDVVSNAIGVGAIENGDTCTILGTTCCNEVVIDHYDPNIDMAGYEKHIVDGLYLHVIASMAGTPNLDWFIDEFFTAEKDEAIKNCEDIFKTLEEKIKNESAVRKGIIYHPYISNSGERAPFYNSNARAQFFGISKDTSKLIMLRAIYEGIAFSIKDCLYRSKNKGKIYLTGGGAKSNLWPQIIADCTGREVIVCQGNEFSAKGAAILAGVSCGIYKDIQEAKEKTIRMKARFIPNKEMVKLYNAFFALYLKIRQNNEALWDRRNSIIQALG